MRSLSFVIPVFNEQDRVQKTFDALKNVSLPRGLHLKEVIFVNDGSTDTTLQKLTNWKFLVEQNAMNPRTLRQVQNTASLRAFFGRPITIKLITYSQNRGKGYAIRQGMLSSTADYTLFFDADMSTPLSELAKFYPSITQGIDVIIGTRKNGHSTVLNHQPLYREVLGRGFTKLTQVLVGVKNTDFTCGFKAFSKRAKDAIFTQSIINGWGYDAEILLLTKKLALTQKEVGVTWTNDDRTHVRLASAIIKTLLELSLLVWIHRLRPKLSKTKPLATYFLVRMNLTK